MRAQSIGHVTAQPECGVGTAVVSRGGVRTNNACGGSSSFISVFSINASSGALTTVNNSPFPVSGTPNSIVVEPLDRYVYVAYGSVNNTIDGFSLNPDGSITELPSAPYAASEGISYIAVDPSDQFVYAAGSGDILTFSLDGNTGNLAFASKVPARIAPFEIAIAKGSTAVTYTPTFTYVASSGGPTAAGKDGGNDISAYSTNLSTGALSALANSPISEGLFPEFAATDLFGRSVYVSNQCASTTCFQGGSMSAYTIDPVAGALTMESGSPVLTGQNPSQVAVDPSGQFVYVINAGDNTISAYTAAGGNSTLNLVPSSPFDVSPYGTGLNAIAMDPSGLSLYVTVTCLGNPCSDGGILVFNIQADGSLQYFNQSSAPSPQSIVASPVGGLLFVPSNTLDAVSVFSTQRAYTSAAGDYVYMVSGSPFSAGQGPVGAVVDPTGKYLYVANAASGTVSAYGIDPVAGTLTSLAGSPFPVGTNPLALTLDISGTYLYVVNNGDSTVSAFTIDPGSGTLTPTAGSPFPADTAPISIVTTGRVQ
jgi:6-phosphogluconolactonase (cycloisomerase 2 family)